MRAVVSESSLLSWRLHAISLDPRDDLGVTAVLKGVDANVRPLARDMAVDLGGHHRFVSVVPPGASQGPRSVVLLCLMRSHLLAISALILLGMGS